AEQWCVASKCSRCREVSSSLAASSSAAGAATARKREPRMRSSASPRSARVTKAASVAANLRRGEVVLQTEVRDLLLSHHPAKRILQLRLLDEEVVLRVNPLGVHRALQVEGEPLLDAGHTGT